MNEFEYIAGNLEKINERIRIAAAKVNKKTSEITLVAVSKKVGMDKIEAAIKAGVKNFGENYIQEGIEKASACNKVNWHFIGHLQSNKAKQALEYFNTIQSIDSVELAVKINNICAQKGKKAELLMQIHYGEEISKHGFLPGEAENAAKLISDMENVCLKGLMTIPPFVENPEDNRHYFKEMKILSEQIFKSSSPILSMGMTDDFEIAIEEGSSMVRIGRAIFGERV